MSITERGDDVAAFKIDHFVNLSRLLCSQHAVDRIENAALELTAIKPLAVDELVCLPRGKLRARFCHSKERKYEREDYR